MTFVHLGMEMGLGLTNSQFLGMEVGMKTVNPIILEQEWDIRANFPKYREGNQEVDKSTSNTQCSKKICHKVIE